MLRKLGIVGLGVPLVAIIVALMYLFLFGTSEPTFEAATKELARDHTVVKISDEPPAAMIVPVEPPQSVNLIVVLPDDDRHVWTALETLGLLSIVERREVAIVPATTGVSAEALWGLVESAREYVPTRSVWLVAYYGEPFESVCSDGLKGEWSGVFAVADESMAPTVTSCGDVRLLVLERTDAALPYIGRWMKRSE